MSQSYTIAEITAQCPVIPVIVINDLEDVIPLGTALIKGGLTVLELTLRTEQGLEAIRLLRSTFPDAIVGAGTVLTPEDLELAIAAGSQFVVSPGTTRELAAAIKAANIPALPGVSTVSEAMELAQLGFKHLKLFPAEAIGGIKLLKSIAGPLSQLSFCTTGGITPSNAKDYLALPNVPCVGGTWMVSNELIANKNWGEIQRLASEAAVAS
ncbi:bifunctional 4-hydroxy-2-oxoglutarate aldolase/2-dehydro-3-deoxy-phosphogluconate aldolase [Umboniibacter marinipuniceus]|uniref:2-dehydro-3-deoxy-phosphogluconate aldolase n=1 Tax=Umboniibacter marinipuniceus TaxID=569599 RepID=A0A3M0AHQ0_9GAMM|nr:bifunctional 4-hydroxy-2-oxoglutarate aldolase/2-dehydro-3-deoxy-phosphogluconate aldolase [Umboniibacter marinipuniceus]RMA82288.1 2-dehydro-3-deoxyphosphogluconate aldolase/(4S)-4-hydroxy-2-oxoglutarate aldolase [Umboniibacter marinipuniceus]